MKFRGWIALDIDGTITTDKYSVPEQVLKYLKKLTQMGWKIVLITGRSKTFSNDILNCFDFPIFFSAQNGAITFKMPENKIIDINLLDNKILFEVERLNKDLGNGIIVNAGIDSGKCYWLKHALSNDMKVFMRDLVERQKTKGVEVDSFEEIELDNFLTIKCIGVLEKITKLSEDLKKINIGEMSIIQDPFDRKYYVLQITKNGVNKGFALKKIIEKFGCRGKIIAAGNDNNDASLLGVADIKIAMADSPDVLIEAADYVAPPAEELGIIFTLKQIMEKIDDL